MNNNYHLFKISFLIILCWSNVTAPSSIKDSKIQQESEYSPQEQELFDQLILLITQGTEITERIEDHSNESDATLEKWFLELMSINIKTETLIKACENTFSIDTWQNAEPDFKQLLKSNKQNTQAYDYFKSRQAQKALENIIVTWRSISPKDEWPYVLLSIINTLIQNPKEIQSLNQIHRHIQTTGDSQPLEHWIFNTCAAQQPLIKMTPQNRELPDHLERDLIQGKNQQVIKYFDSDSSTIMAPDHEGRTPLIKAAVYKNSTLFDYAAKKMAKHYSLKLSTSQNYLKAVKFIIADPGCPVMREMTLQKKCDNPFFFNSRNNMPFICALTLADNLTPDAASKVNTVSGLNAYLLASNVHAIAASNNPHVLSLSTAHKVNNFYDNYDKHQLKLNAALKESIGNSKPLQNDVLSIVSGYAAGEYPMVDEIKPTE